MSATVLCFGEILLRLSSPNKELLLQSARFDAHVGGAEANVALSLSKFGHETAVVSTLPESALGHACAGELRRHGVQTEALRFCDGRMGLYFLTHGAGHRPADLIFGDERDFAFMLDGNTDAAFAAFKNLQFVACTSRARHSADTQEISGSLRSRRDTYTTRPYSLYGIVDRIGAGDAFAAGVLHGLIRSFDAQKTIDFATAAAVLKHSIHGDFNLVSEADVELLLSERGTDVRR